MQYAMSLKLVPKQIIIDGIIFFMVCLPSIVLYLMGQEAISGFWCNDQSLSYPYKPDTVSQSLLLFMSFGGPFIMMSLTESVRAALSTKPRRFRQDLFSIGKGYTVFLFGIAVTLLFTEMLKFYVGRLRPHFFDLCKPKFGSINCTDGIDRYISDYECTNTQINHKLLRDSHMSFPSGHASISMYSALFTIFYLQSRVQVSFSYFLRPLIQLCILMMAVLCCVSRIRDNKHFASDVAAGTFLGVTFAWLSFYKIAEKVIPNTEKESPASIRRATSIESEPQTPTPLLRPERLVLNHHLQHNGYRSGTPSISKENV